MSVFGEGTATSTHAFARLLVYVAAQYKPRRSWEQRTFPRREKDIFGLPNETFRQNFRVTKDQFWELLDIISPHLPKRPGTDVPDRVVLVGLLWMFAHGCSLQAVQFSIGISKSMCSTHFPAFAKAIIDGLDNISFPTGEELKEEQRRWAQDDFLEGCVTAADGVHIRYTPTTNGHEERWRNRKGFKSQNVLVCASFDRQIQHVVVGCEGSCHDASVVATADLTSKLPEGSFGLFDAAMRLTHKR
ncbi:hypothetical protein PTSG_00641 [Salpingoeca rosetta]|nr:uncharacterized protein PTSG_00641 [Salpingoeca rosetta]EGD75934.1 hypothetical protein PTSG_00641 [Salpingoeca rosetta]|eukprot:XP_004998110.1 hypothetical protein PTSG_00641 [Salpingoeca rosetta]